MDMLDVQGDRQEKILEGCCVNVCSV